MRGILVASLLLACCTPSERAYNCTAQSLTCANDYIHQRNIVEARRVTRIARAYALSGSCAAVEKMAVHVRDLDPIVYTDVFLHDAAILQSCYPAYLEEQQRWEREDTAARGRPPDPTDDPKQTWSFWCNAGGRCTADERPCGAGCTEQSVVWCAVYNTQTLPSEHFLCGASRESCVRLKDEARAYGGYDWRDCVPRSGMLSR